MKFFFKSAPVSNYKGYKNKCKNSPFSIFLDYSIFIAGYVKTQEDILSMPHNQFRKKRTFQGLCRPHFGIELEIYSRHSEHGMEILGVRFVCVELHMGTTGGDP